MQLKRRDERERVIRAGPSPIPGTNQLPGINT